jgi:preprotein translocase subunit SecA
MFSEDLRVGERPQAEAHAQAGRAINALEPEMEALSDEALRAQDRGIPQTRRRRRNARRAAARGLRRYPREAAKRALGQAPFRCAAGGGMVLHQGKIAEMKTGEGKTLVATLPVYLNALEGKGVPCRHRQRLSRPARRRMDGQGLWLPRPDVRRDRARADDEARRAAYACDVTYATNNELGFDYLRDNMKFRLEEMVQRGHLRHRRRGRLDPDRRGAHAADHLRPDAGPVELYIAIDKMIPQLEEEHYEIDEKQRTVILTEDRQRACRGAAARGRPDPARRAASTTSENVTLVHHVNQALRAHKLFTARQGLHRQGRQGRSSSTSSPAA